MVLDSVTSAPQCIRQPRPCGHVHTAGKTLGLVRAEEDRFARHLRQVRIGDTVDFPLQQMPPLPLAHHTHSNTLVRRLQREIPCSPSACMLTRRLIEARSLDSLLLSPAHTHTWPFDRTVKRTCSNLRSSLTTVCIGAFACTWSRSIVLVYVFVCLFLPSKIGNLEPVCFITARPITKLFAWGGLQTIPRPSKGADFGSGSQLTVEDLDQGEFSRQRQSPAGGLRECDASAASMRATTNTCTPVPCSPKLVGLFCLCIRSV